MYCFSLVLVVLWWLLWRLLCWLFLVLDGCLQFALCCLLFAAWCCLLYVVCCLLVALCCCSLLPVCRLLFSFCCLLLVTCYLLLVDCCSLRLPGRARVFVFPRPIGAACFPAFLSSRARLLHLRHELDATSRMGWGGCGIGMLTSTCTGVMKLMLRHGSGGVGVGSSFFILSEKYQVSFTPTRPPTTYINTRLVDYIVVMFITRCMQNET